MRVNKVMPLSPSDRARRLGLTSKRFYEGEISKHAKEAI